jgi:dipeptidyl aminopeptidase/acylaminoacyl peptidase
MLRLLSLAVFFGLIAGAVHAVETHPFSVHDMLAMDRISDPRVSPDGKVVVFTVSVTDLEKNKRRSDLYLAAADGSWVRRLTTHDAGDTQPRWSRDGKSVFFVSTRSGSSQVWRIAVDGGEAEQVTKLPLDVDALEVAPTGGFLVFSMAVFPGKTPELTKDALDEKEKRKASGMLFDRLFVRHWDAWEDGTRNHLFVYPLPSGPAHDLMLSMDADCPSRPFGGSTDYSISPDGTTVVFSAKDVGREEAWSTNFDLFAAPVDGSVSPRRLTTNPATDGTPAFSPDGKTLAYLAMTRPGYEADRNDIVLRDWATGTERRVTLRADASPNGDRSPSGLAWTPDAGQLLCVAEHLGQSAVFAVDATSGRARILVGEGTCSDPQVCAGGRILYAMNSLQGPAELYTISADGRDTRRVTTTFTIAGTPRRMRARDTRW